MSDHSLLKTPGEMILEAREAQDLTIAQLSERTKIPPAVLSALEMDEFHKVSGPLYIKSFLRTCALDLGLNPQTVLNQYERISGEIKSGPVGKAMVWKEDEVLINRVGLPWLRIIVGAGIVAILFGVGLFALRGCGNRGQSPDSLPSGDGGQTGEDRAVVAVLAEDSVSNVDPDHESLIPAQTEADLRERADALEEWEAASRADRESRSSASDSLAVGWLMTPPPAEKEEEIQAASDAASDSSAQGESYQETDGQPAVEVPQELETTRDSEPMVTDTALETALEDPAENTTQEITDHLASDEDYTPEPSTETRVEESSIPEVPVEITSDEGSSSDEPVETPRSPAQVDSAWPLVLRIVCDAPQEILVKRDSDRQFSSVRWPDDFSAAPPVPAAGFEAGRAYSQGQRLVIFWGAEDHFSLKLARARDVEVLINGRVRDVSRLRPGQELVLDAHAAGSPADR